ncbi:MAG: DUF2723 domain-containing protein [Verrucomicrobiae bacterium]|nr:DUF2723 domain-containing protein [Verrucomicrobiae bacterium]
MLEGGAGSGQPQEPALAAPGFRPSRTLRQWLWPKSDRPPLFRKVDWWCFLGTSIITLLAYLITIAPDLTLEDCGELAVASYYAGVPHAPGYPIWTLYTWVFANLLPIANVAFRVAVSSAVAAALANGLLGLIVSRGSSMILEGIPMFRGMERRLEDSICLVAGSVAALLIGFNGFMWSQAVIVEVYTLSVLSLVGVMVCLLHWTYAPTGRRYLYLAAFLFGICFNNHQTLILAAMGLEVLVAMVQPRLGRDAFIANSVIYIVLALAMWQGVFTSFDQNNMLLAIFHGVGIASLVAAGWITYGTGGLAYEPRPGYEGCAWLNRVTLGLLGRRGYRYVGPGSEWRAVLAALCAWLFGASFYFLMPLLSVTNPPMNWAYPRTWDGFWHAFSRGQYEKTNPTDLFAEGGIARLGYQLLMYFEGAAEEFHPVFLMLAVIPFVFLGQMQRRERAWIIGNTAIYACLAFLLLVLLNPTPDKQSRDLTKVFFTASHVTIAMFAGFGLTLVSALLLRYYREVRLTALAVGATAVALAMVSLGTAVEDIWGDPLQVGDQSGVIAGLLEGLRHLKVLWSGFWSTLLHPSATSPVFGVLATAFVLAFAVAFVAIILVQRDSLKPRTLLGFFAVIPLFSIISHWPENEQREHLFGFWFGHDMFTPPFELYEPMTKDAVLFGGTDPGRFCPTYMIFCESFIKPSRRRDPDFDRRDVYIITQNALADGTYLDYIRAHYNRSTQVDPPFLRDGLMRLSDRLLPAKERQLKELGKPYQSTALSRFALSLTNLTAPFDRMYLAFGAAVERGRRERGVYPAEEITTPSPLDLQQSFDTYMADAARRYEHDAQFPNEPPQVRQGEVFNITPDGRIQVQGQAAVMAINALLTKDIFDANPDHEFYVEESFPLDWMFPHLSPYGIIMKINREPVTELTEEDLERNHEFWTRYSERLCGNWITYDTPVAELCDFVERVYRRGDLRGYTGDPKFVRDLDAQKSFAKLRGSQAGLLDWRMRFTTNAAERERLTREAEFACKQTFAFCPFSPESVARYVQLLAGMNRMEDALLLAQTALRFDTESSYLQLVIRQLTGFVQTTVNSGEAQKLLAQYEQAYQAAPTNLNVALTLVSAYATLGRTNDAFAVLDRIVDRPGTEPSVLMAVADAYMQLGQYGRTEAALRRLVLLMPETPELWYDLAGAQVALGSNAAAMASLRACFTVNEVRKTANTNAADLRRLAETDSRFRPLRSLKEFQQLLRGETLGSPQ